MIYTNGFFVFRFVNDTFSYSINNNEGIVEIWEDSEQVTGFRTYLYSWLDRDPYGFKNKFNQTLIWIDYNRKNVIVFLRSEKLVNHVINAIERRFSIYCVPDDLIFNSKITNNGDIIVLLKGTNDKNNRVNTSLINNSLKRASIVECVLAGG